MRFGQLALWVWALLENIVISRKPIAGVCLLVCFVLAATQGIAGAALLFQDDFNDLDGNVTITDKIQGAMGTLLGNVTRSSTEVAPSNSGGFAVDFSTNTTTDAVSYGNLTVLHNKSELTISMWIKPDTIRTDGSRLITKTSTGGNQQIWDFEVREHTAPNRSIRMGISTAGGAGGSSAYGGTSTTGAGPCGRVALDEWQFVAISWVDATSTGSFYRGTLAGGLLGPETDTLDGGILSTTQPLLLGNIGSPGLRNFHGLIDNVRIYDNALSSADLDGVMRFDDVPIPEPGTLSLVLIGALGLVARRKRK